jgi:hypothetical protein
VFQSLVNRAQRSVDSLVSKYVARVAVAVPFMVAMGFGTAAASVKLTAEYGSMTAYTILAVAFSAIGLVAAVVIALSSSQPAATTNANPQQDSETASDQTSDSREPNFPIDPATVLSMIATVGPAFTPPLLKLLARNLPLVTGLAILAYLLFADAGKRAAEASSAAAET